MSDAYGNNTFNYYFNACCGYHDFDLCCTFENFVLFYKGFNLCRGMIRVLLPDADFGNLHLIARLVEWDFKVCKFLIEVLSSCQIGGWVVYSGSAPITVPIFRQLGVCYDATFLPSFWLVVHVGYLTTKILAYLYYEMENGKGLAPQLSVRTRRQ